MLIVNELGCVIVILPFLYYLRREADSYKFEQKQNIPFSLFIIKKSCKSGIRNEYCTY